MIPGAGMGITIQPEILFKDTSFYIGFSGTLFITFTNGHNTGYYQTPVLV